VRLTRHEKAEREDERSECERIRRGHLFSNSDATDAGPSVADDAMKRLRHAMNERAEVAVQDDIHPAEASAIPARGAELLEPITVRMMGHRGKPEPITRDRVPFGFESRLVLGAKEPTTEERHVVVGLQSLVTVFAHPLREVVVGI